jgi:hypothetical protein
MAQLHCYVPDGIADKVRQRAEQSRLSVSAYLSELIKREVSADHWPEGYAELFDQWEGDPPVREPNGELETRLAIE